MMTFPEVLKLFSDSIEQASNDKTPYMSDWVDSCSSEQLLLTLTFFLMLPVKILQKKVQSKDFSHLDNTEQIAFEIYKCLKMGITFGETPWLESLLDGIIPKANIESFDDIVKVIYPDGHALLTRKLNERDFDYFMNNYVMKRYGSKAVSYTDVNVCVKDYINDMFMQDDNKC